MFFVLTAFNAFCKYTYSSTRKWSKGKCSIMAAWSIIVKWLLGPCCPQLFHNEVCWRVHQPFVECVHMVVAFQNGNLTNTLLPACGTVLYDFWTIDGVHRFFNEVLTMYLGNDGSEECKLVCCGSTILVSSRWLTIIVWVLQCNSESDQVQALSGHVNCPKNPEKSFCLDIYLESFIAWQGNCMHVKA